MNIEEQKQIADYVLEKLELADPYCVIAGGAPRDWHYDQVANDLDVYYFTSANTVTASRKQLEQLFGVKVTALCEIRGSITEDVNLYSTMPFLKRIWNAEMFGQKVQFIQLTEPNAQFKVVDYMDVSVCQIAYKHGKTIPHRNFKLGDKLKAMWTLNDCKWSDKHPQKMCDRFPEMSKINEFQLQNMLVRKVLNGD